MGFSLLKCNAQCFKLFQVIVPLLVTDDEKTLVTCINCLTKVIISWTTFLLFWKCVSMNLLYISKWGGVLLCAHMIYQCAGDRGGHGSIFEENWTEPIQWFEKLNRTVWVLQGTEPNQSYGSVNRFVVYKPNLK